MAMIMTDTSFAIPTAVITESSENTMSSRRIWNKTQPNAARALDYVFGLDTRKGWED